VKNIDFWPKYRHLPEILMSEYQFPISANNTDIIKTSKLQIFDLQFTVYSLPEI